MKKFRLQADASFEALDYFDAAEKLARYFSDISEARYWRQDFQCRGHISLRHAHMADDVEVEDD